MPPIATCACAATVTASALNASTRTGAIVCAAFVASSVDVSIAVA